jgi:hypothetical protein
MRTIIRKTGLSIQPRRLDILSEEEFKARKKDKSIVQVGPEMYEEVDEATYETKVMTAKKKKVVKKKPKPQPAGAEASEAETDEDEPDSEA